MPQRVNNCRYAFETIAAVRLPRHFDELQRSIDKPALAGQFVKEKGNGKRAVLGKLRKRSDFKGCYVFVENEVPLYVGISRAVVQRLIQHLKANDHYSGSLAYQIAMESGASATTRAENMKNSRFRKNFERAQKRLAACDIGVVEITDCVELHLFEVYAAMRLGTGRYNTFTTH